MFMVPSFLAIVVYVPSLGDTDYTHEQGYSFVDVFSFMSLAWTIIRNAIIDC